MKLIIDIPEEEYKNICLMSKDGIGMALYDWIANGTPLPKGHGRLIDISEYEKYFNTEIRYDDGNTVHSTYTNNIPTIIEADKAESEDKE